MSRLTRRLVPLVMAAGLIAQPGARGRRGDAA